MQVYALETRDKGKPVIYIGITKSPDADVRLKQHVLQAIKDHRTVKDKLIYAQVVNGGHPSIVTLFHSNWSEEDIQNRMLDFVTTEPTKRRDKAVKSLTGQDEMAVTIFFRDILGTKLLNIAAGTEKKNVSKAIVVPPVSPACQAWMDSIDISEVCDTITPATLSFMRQKKALTYPLKQVKDKAVNSVVWDDQETLMVVTPTRIDLMDHKFCGPNTTRIYFKWRNTILGSPNDEQKEAYIDTYKVTSGMKVGKDYAIFTEKRIAPDNPYSKCWWWGNNFDFNHEFVLRSLKERLIRIEAVKKTRLADWSKLTEMEDNTLFSINGLTADAEDGVSVNHLITYLR